MNLIDLVTGAKSVMAMQGQASGAPWTCASGRYLLYDIFDSGNGNQNVGRMDTSTSDTKQLTNERVASAPVCSSDVQWVYYISQADEQRLARVSIDGGSSQIISELPMSELSHLSQRQTRRVPHARTLLPGIKKCSPWSPPVGPRPRS